MKTIEYWTFENKAEWGDGPWVDEPDKIQWQDDATGLPCLIVRNNSGALCGYVGVTAEHPLHKVYYDDVDHDQVSAHGGLTFSDHCAPSPSPERWDAMRQHAADSQEEAARYPYGDAARFLQDRAKQLQDYEAYKSWSESSQICHKVEPGEDDNVWWFGFDCSHAGDLSPAFENRHRAIRMQMRDEHPEWWANLDRGEIYRDVTYVKAECQELAQKLKAFTVTDTVPPKMTISVEEHRDNRRAEMRAIADRMRERQARGITDIERLFADEDDDDA